MKDWLTVDKDGLAQLLRDRGKEFAIFELVSNAWDEAATTVVVELKPVQGKPWCTLLVKDDSPDGWHRLEDSWTLFAPSVKKGEAEKRGRFNLGEKLVLAMCHDAVLETMGGTVFFDKKHGRKLYESKKAERGTKFTAVIEMTREEHRQACEKVSLLIPPPGVETTFNGEPLKRRTPAGIVRATLPTVLSDADGNLRRTRRAAEVTTFEPLPGEVAHLYEMGIPVVATGDRYHVNVAQKIPLNTDRDNVTPGFLRKIRGVVLNLMHQCIDERDATQTWAQDAASSPDVSVAALESILTKQFGEKRVMFDPSDPEGSKLAVSKGYTVVHGRSLPEGVRDNIKGFRKSGKDVLPPAGQVTPSPKAYAKDGMKTVVPLDESELDNHMKKVRRYAQAVHAAIIPEHRGDLVVKFVRVPNFQAAYGKGELHFSVQVLGKKWFADVLLVLDGLEKIDDLLIHEFAHYFSTDHLDDRYLNAVSKLGARLARACRWRDPRSAVWKTWPKEK